MAPEMMRPAIESSNPIVTMNPKMPAPKNSTVVASRYPRNQRGSDGTAEGSPCPASDVAFRRKRHPRSVATRDLGGRPGEPMLKRRA
jgi:hypothetical protein